VTSTATDLDAPAPPPVSVGDEVVPDTGLSLPARIDRRLAEPPRWLFNGPVLSAMGFVLWRCSFPNRGVPGWVILFLLLTGSIWLSRVNMASRRRKSADLVISKRFLIPCVAGFVMVGLAVTSVPDDIRWAFAQGGFERERAELHRADPAAPTDWSRHRIAGLAVRGPVRDGAETWFHYVGQVDSYGFLTSSDLWYAHLPQGARESERVQAWSQSDLHIQDLGDDWYLVDFISD
jgi:hypothetical protein